LLDVGFDKRKPMTAIGDFFLCHLDRRLDFVLLLFVHLRVVELTFELGDLVFQLTNRFLKR